jgi:CRP-like cAMP-binding protein
MPQPYDIRALELPPESEMLALLREFPDAQVLRFGDEELLVRAGSECDAFFLLLRGTVIVELPPPPPEGAQQQEPQEEPQQQEPQEEPQQQEPQEEPPPRHHGSEISVLTATPGKPIFLGEMACFGGGLRSAHVRSSMNSVAIKLPTEHLHPMLEHFPRLTRTLCEQFSERLLELNEQLRKYRDVLFMKAEQRFFEAGETLFKAGQPADQLFQLVDGTVSLSGAPDEEVRPGRGGAIFLEPLPYFSGQAHQRTATAKNMVIAVSIALSSREAVVRNFPYLMLQLFEQATANRA